MRLKSQLKQPLCPRHGCAKTRPGKLSASGVRLLYCSLCLNERWSQHIHDAREAKYNNDPREIAAFARIDKYLAEQAEAVSMRRRAARENYQSPLGSPAVRGRIQKPKGVKSPL